MLLTFNDDDPNYVWIFARGGEELDYTWDWSEQLAEDGGDTIDSGRVTVTQHASLTPVKKTNTTTAVSAWFATPEVRGEDMWIRCQIETLGGRKYSKKLYLRMV